ncbi:GNAT family N-acetyltransferase [Ornithinibacillus halophilus]|uniref:Ribosomal protein S18 acetylase RimI n=1 Tax=Ornithinibacillus halophilus TaxID=930117 RepID=A0A1M5HQL7_9BACI|nr:GNAT family N-acetyltransferase [Ornithinibacillus halophilus]SHG18230.1 Ribosomal protein S18 acetylase RimI [Ornithinibacillus halophilus]
MNFTIRKANQEDKKQVQDVATSSWHSTYEGIIPIEVQDNFLNAAYSDENMKYRIENSLLLVAEAEGKVVGFANFSPVNKEGQAELGAIYLKPDAQGKGIGTALLQHGINSLEDVKEIYINVERDNEIGKTFYEAKGFNVVKEFDDEFDGHILKTLRMVLKVNRK